MGFVLNGFSILNIDFNYYLWLLFAHGYNTGPSHVKVTRCLLSIGGQLFGLWNSIFATYVHLVPFRDSYEVKFCVFFLLKMLHAHRLSSSGGLPVTSPVLLLTWASYRLQHVSLQHCGYSDTLSGLISLALIRFRDIGFLKDYILISPLLCIIERIVFQTLPSTTASVSFLHTSSPVIYWQLTQSTSKTEEAFKCRCHVMLITVRLALRYLILWHNCNGNGNHHSAADWQHLFAIGCSALCCTFYFHTFCFAHWRGVSMISLPEHCHLVH